VTPGAPAALAFLLSSRHQPVVLVAIAVAFPAGQVVRLLPRQPGAAIIVDFWAAPATCSTALAVDEGAPRRPGRRPFDLLRGGSSSSGRRPPTLQTVVPRRAPTPGPVVLALAVWPWRWPSAQAGAFIAASFCVPLTPHLAFAVVGPMVDVKLVALQAGVRARLRCASRRYARGGGHGAWSDGGCCERPADDHLLAARLLRLR
jgi:hypothetical protein